MASSSRGAPLMSVTTCSSRVLSPLADARRCRTASGVKLPLS